MSSTDAFCVILIGAVIADRVGVWRPTVIDWRGRYERSGVSGLDDEPRSGRPRSVDHDAIITATWTPPPKKLGITHWSSRLLAKYLKIGNATVAQAWRDYGTLPPREQRFQHSPRLIRNLLPDRHRISLTDNKTNSV
jgi:hypothetical protein